ncbi:hypothetical protein ACOMHN_018154 [Nucella lapillus]
MQHTTTTTTTTRTHDDEERWGVGAPRPLRPGDVMTTSGSGGGQSVHGLPYPTDQGIVFQTHAFSIARRTRRRPLHYFTLLEDANI